MPKNLFFASLTAKAKKESAKAFRSAAESIISKASVAAKRKGLSDQDVDVDDVLEGIKALKNKGGISRREFEEITKKIKTRFHSKKT